MTGIPRTFALTGARIHTAVDDSPVEYGTILVAEGVIEAVKTGIEIQKDRMCFNVSGKCITPGFIDAHSHTGLIQLGEGSIGKDNNNPGDPVQPMLRALDGIKPDDEGFNDALQHGVTAQCISPGSTNVIAGQMALVKSGSVILDEILIDGFTGLKCALGENPKVHYSALQTTPSSRMGIVKLIREAFLDAVQYNLAKQDAQKHGRFFAIDESKEVLCRILNREKPIRIHAHRIDDIQTAIRIAEEFNLDLVIEHATQGWMIANWLASKKVAVVLGPINTAGLKQELRGRRLDTARIFEEAGIEFAVMTDAPYERAGALFDDVCLAVRNGLSRETALKSITRVPAKILGQSHRIGGIFPGADADLNIFSGDPFDSRNRIETVIIDGKIKYGVINE